MPQFFVWLKAIHCVRCAYCEEGVIYGVVVYQGSVVAKCNPVYVQYFVQDYFCHFYSDIPEEVVWLVACIPCHSQCHDMLAPQVLGLQVPDLF